MALETNIVLRSQDLATPGIKAATTSMQGLGVAVNQVGATFTKFIGGGLVGGALAQLVTSSAEAGKELKLTAQRLGITTDELQDYQHMAKLTGLETDALAKGMSRLGVKVSEAFRGMGEAQAVFRDLGLSAADLAKLDAASQLEQIADAIAKVGLHSDQARIAAKLFGDDNGTRFLALLENGSAGIRSMKDEIHGLAKLSPDEIESLNTLSNLLDRITNAVSVGIKKDIAKITKMGTNFWNTGDRMQADINAMLARDRGLVPERLMSELRITAQSPVSQPPEPFRFPWSNPALYQQANSAMESAANALVRGSRMLPPDYFRTQGFSGPGIGPPVIDQPASPGFNMEPGRPYDEIRGSTLGPQNFKSGWIDALNEVQTKFDETWKTAADKGRYMAESTARVMSQTFESVFFDALDGRLRKLGDYLNDFLRGIAKAIAQQLSTQAALSIMSGIGLKLPARASGGPVTAGMPYLVGEAGPEIMVPSASGSIIPSGRGKAGGGVTVNIVNQSGVPQTARQAYVQDDMGRTVIGIVLEALNTNRGGLRSAINGASA